MSFNVQPYVGEIRMFGGSFAPAGWAFCNGQLKAISEYDTLFNLIGTTYGGDGQSTFALPDLRGRMPLHMGTGGGQTTVIGQSQGTESVMLIANNLPVHTHTLVAAAAPSAYTPSGTLLASELRNESPIYTTTSPNTAMAGNAITSVGTADPIDNTKPSLAVSFIISLYGIYPSPT